jgi:DNA-binding IclR family transcriptional regulator
LHALESHLTVPAGRQASAAGRVPAVVRAVALLDRLAQQRAPMSMARLAAELALPRSSVHGLCNTLLALGYLRRQGDGQLAIGPRVMSLAEAFIAGTDVAREFESLWQSVAPQQAPDETMLLSVLDGGDVIYLATRNGTRPLGMAFNKGMRLPAHLSATGRAMLAFQAPEQVQRLLADAPLRALTPRSLTDAIALAAELDATRQRGYSIDDEGVRLGVYGLAAPVLDAGGRVLAGVGVCLNKAMLDAADLARQRQLVLGTARALSQRLGGEGLPAESRFHSMAASA